MGTARSASSYSKDGSRPGTQSEIAGRVAVAALVLLLGATYLATLLPGVGAGDTAELQVMSALLGVCHSPGYAIEVAFGKLFSLLPIGPGVAWRVNLMMAVSGVAGCLALYGTVLRITGRPVAGFCAATLLGFSSIYWGYSIAAEVYVFHTMLLLVAVYAAVLFVTSNRTGWLLVSSFSFGMCVAGRPSELFVFPAFVGLWLGFRQRAPLDPGRVLAAALALLLPFVLSVGFVLVRSDPAYLSTRDAALVSRITGEEPPIGALSGIPRLQHAVAYSLSMYWLEKAARKTTLEDARSGLARYLRHLTVTPLRGNPPPRTLREQEQGVGTSIGPLGLALAALGVVWYRRERHWLWLGLGLFGGNLAFYLWHVRWDGLTFTAPGIAGLALLAGLGAGGPRGRAGLGLGWNALGMVAAALLFAGNYRAVDRSEQLEPLWMPHLPQSQLERLPRNTALIMPPWFAQTYRYLLYVEGGREDVQVLAAGPRQRAAVVAHFRSSATPVFVYRGLPPPGARVASPMARFGFQRVPPPGAGRRSAEEGATSGRRLEPPH